MSYNVAFTRRSRNSKTGPIPVTTTTRRTCSKTCPFANGGGCYAEIGPLGMFWSKVDDGRAGGSWDDMCAEVAALPEEQLWRHNQGGDMPGDGVRIDAEATAKLVAANRDRRGYTYCHYEPSEHNLAVIRAANEAGFTINLSGNNPAHADTLADTGAGPVVTVLPTETGRKADRRGNWTETVAEYRARVPRLATPAGRTIVVCPATYRDDVNCMTCGLCQRQRSTVVGFPAHGVSAKRADAVARG